MARLDRQVIGVVARQFAQEPERLASDTRLVEDLQGDSLDSLELQMQVEHRFAVFIEDDDWCAIVTIGDIAAQVAACRRARRSGVVPPVRRGLPPPGRGARPRVDRGRA